MIAKRVMSPKGGSGYQRLSGYVLNVDPKHREATDPASWTRLGAYILDADHHGEKVAWARATNCGSDDPGWAVKDILTVQAQNTRAKADKSYHLVVSFPEGERPTREQIEDIEDRLCESIGFGEHQRVSAVHQNTDNWHLHIAINKVHPTTLRCVTPRQDHFKLQAACQHLEIKHDLTRERHTVSPEQKRQIKIHDFQVRDGGQTFLEWTKEHAKAALLSAKETGQGWEDMHRAAAPYGLTLKLRGAGLVIGHHKDKKLHIKASDVDRSLSFKSLTDKFGTFQSMDDLQQNTTQTQDDTGKRPSQPQQPEPQKAYERPKPSGVLYDNFQKERDDTRKARDEALQAAEKRHAEHKRADTERYRQRAQETRTEQQPAYRRREAINDLSEQRQKSRDKQSAERQKERQHIRSVYQTPTWQSFLERRAADGDADALKALRARQIRRQQMETDFISAENPDDAFHVLLKHMRPAVRRDGRVIYAMQDGGLVSDEADKIRVVKTSENAVLFALSLGQQRFGNRPLVVNGSEEFRSQAAAIAASHGVAVTFADRALEQQRISTRNQTQKILEKEKGQTHTSKGTDHSRDGGMGR
jgi:hypothetical protein